MDRLKTFRKYILWIIGFYIFSSFLIYIGLNSTYKNIKSIKTNAPEQVSVKIAQATKVNGRIYGEVLSTTEKNLNGKYLKIDLFDRNVNLCGTKYLKLENLQENIQKKFAVNFTKDGVKYYDVSIIEPSEKVDEEMNKCEMNYRKIFTNDELSGGMILALVIVSLYI